MRVDPMQCGREDGRSESVRPTLYAERDARCKIPEIKYRCNAKCSNPKVRPVGRPVHAVGRSMELSSSYRYVVIMAP
jgi:hypothetical protein